MVENEFRDENGKMISDSVSVKNQLNIDYMKKIMSDILVNVLASVISFVCLVNT